MKYTTAYKGYIVTSSCGHGKASKGMKKTSTIRIEDHSKTMTGFQIIKQFKYNVDDVQSMLMAIKKAFSYIDKL